MDYNALTKRQLVEITKAVTGEGGDYARRSKADYVEIVSGLPADAVATAMQSVVPVFAAAPLRLVPRPATPAPAAPVTPSHVARPCERTTLGAVFGTRGKFSKVECTVWDDPSAPELDKFYRFDPETLATAVMAIEGGENIWAYGPAGSGKTEFWQNVAAGLGRRFVRVNCDRSVERYEMIGGERVIGGSTVYQYGSVLRGIVHAGAIVCLDEVSLARAENLSALHACLEPSGKVTVTETGEVIRRAPGVVFVAADNSNGRGDMSGMYAGIGECNYAFTDRFSVFLPFSYPEPAVETKILCDRTGVPTALAEAIVRFMGVARKAQEGAQLDAAPTLRQAMALARRLHQGVKPRFAFEVSIVNRASIETQETLQQLWKQNVNEADLAALAGQPADQPEPAIQPEG